MEIKISSAVPRWFADILTELDIRPVSFSKYGNIFKREHGVPLEWVTGKAAYEKDNTVEWVTGDAFYEEEKIC